MSLLSDKEDRETASAKATISKPVKDKATEAFKPDENTEDILDEASGDEEFVPDGKKKKCQKHDTQLNPGTRDGPVCLNPAVLTVRQNKKSQVNHVSIQVVQ